MTPAEREDLRKKIGVTERTFQGYEKHIRRGAQLAHGASFTLGSLLVDPVWGYSWLVIGIWAKAEDEKGVLLPSVTLAPSVVPTRRMLADMGGAGARMYRSAGCLLHKNGLCLLFVPRLSPTVPTAFARYWSVGRTVQSRFAERAGDYLERAVHKEHLVGPLPRALERTRLPYASDSMEFYADMWEEIHGDSDVQKEEYENFVDLLLQMEEMEEME